MRQLSARAIGHELHDDEPSAARGMSRRARWLSTLLLAVAAGMPLPSGAAEAATPAATAAAAVPAGDKVVYHVGDSDAQALQALRNVRNHLDADPTAQITVVTLATGVDFLMEGAKDKTGAGYEGLVAALHNRGVRFEVCEITLKNRGLSKDKFLQEVDFTPSGVVRLAKLQIQGYAYIKP
ncbi:MAG TPA: DsrE family protein [Ideonella sp.]|uniref:DsrE family protein n=1 Tax=Ideonella sp. TaxID=1929293 RepID=UPI002B8F40E6|nr:DsrE family protein [Ideonella sp.]HSI49703.1 DsrE family protein [Ideonella sp.]